MDIFKKRTILLKIVVGYLLALSLLIGMVFFSLIRLDKIKKTVDDLTNKLAVTRELSQSVTDTIRLVRFHAERYRRFYRQEDLDRFNDKIIDLKQGLAKIDRQVVHPVWRENIRHIQNETDRYEKLFEDITRLIMLQQSLLSTTFLKQELLIENQLSAIRINVGIVQNPDIFFSFGNARNAFQLMRLYQSKYLSEDDEKYYVMFKSNYGYASQAFSKLNEALKIVSGKSRIDLNAVRANDALKVYYETFLDIRSASLELKKLSRKLDGHELEITRTASDTASAIETEYQLHNRSTQELLLRTQVELVVAVIIAISLSLGLIFVVSRKITAPLIREMRREAEELKIAKIRAEKASQVKSEFVANMSHEFRTPLNAVIGFSELLSDMVSDHRQQRFVQAIHTAGRNLLRLIDDILDHSKIEAGKLQLNPSSVNLKELLGEIEQIFHLKVTEKKLHFAIDVADDLPDWLYLDETRMRQILLNLVGNALKFTDTGHVNIAVRPIPSPAPFSPSPDNEESISFMLSVLDTGIGIPEEDQEKVFQSFEQQSNQNSVKYGGTGLGLSITRQLVELMGGKIGLISTPGEGSRFDISFFNVSISTEKRPAADHIQSNPISPSKKSPSKRPGTTGGPVDLPKEIVTAGIDHPDRLMNRLKEEISPAFQSLEKAFVINEFEKLGKALGNLGNELRAPELSTFGNHMQQLADTFDIQGMNNAVATISKTIETAINALEHHNG